MSAALSRAAARLHQLHVRARTMRAAEANARTWRVLLRRVEAPLAARRGKGVPEALCSLHEEVSTRLRAAERELRGLQIAAEQRAGDGP